jgi:hypothetical protein
MKPLMDIARFSAGQPLGHYGKEDGELIGVYNIAVLITIVVLLLVFLVWKKVKNRRRPKGDG